MIFDNDTKVGGEALAKTDYEIIQRDLNDITEWPEKWQMFFNPEKLKSRKMGPEIVTTHISSKENICRRYRKNRILASKSAAT